MAKCIKQLRYYSDLEKNKNNQPTYLEKKFLLKNDENIFKEEYSSITKLGIQTLPGTRFYLNDGLEGPIIIGLTGIYELDLEGISEINNLYFDLKSLELIENNNSAYLIIDIIYDK